MNDQYVWLIWASAFLVPWGILYRLCPSYRKRMLGAGIATTPFGLTEPLFIPEYWNPPSLFDLAARTGFDVESLLFCFGIGGVGVVLYDALTRRSLAPLPEHERLSPRHRFHRIVLATPFLLFIPLVVLPWNPIYPSVVCLSVGAFAAIWCRPDLKGKTFVGGAIFLGYYAVFLMGLELLSPGYIERVWNLDALSGISIVGFPLEELAFALTFGMYWSTAYEHFSWSHAVERSSPMGKSQTS